MQCYYKSGLKINLSLKVRLFWGVLFYYPNSEKSKNNRSFIFIPLVLVKILKNVFFMRSNSEIKNKEIKNDRQTI